MDRINFKVLEIDKIIELLKKKTVSSMGAELVDKLSFYTDYDDVAMAQEETTQAQSILIKRGHVPLDGISDIKSYVKRAEVGAVLDTRSLIRVADNMRAARILFNLLSGNVVADNFGASKNINHEKEDEEENVYPIIGALAQALYTHRDVENEIFDSILGENEIADSASSTLRDIRRRIVQKNQSIRSKLNQIITSSLYQKYLQDSIISMRGDRFVVPIKAEYRSSFPGIIHDQSQSGSTLFVEPMSIVEMNNDLKKLRLSEQEEIERILAELSSRVGEVAGELVSNQEILAKLDFIFAKGKLSLSMKAIEPKLNKDKKLSIVNGRHPLLDRNKVVPNTVYMGEDFSTLLITGPNTGGKTVTIKMVGMFACMTQLGLHICADYGSSMCVFDNIFADIGDQQSIEENLSTFSSHMTRIVEIIDNITDNSLVIFDELGAGTDPQEGAALAIAILERIYSSGSLCIATTHYSELKKYALAKPYVNNAAVEFDMDTLSPTYRLLIGVAGRSNAFEISKKLGLDSYVIEKARSFMDHGDVELEEILDIVEKNRLQTEQELEIARKNREEADRILSEYEEKLERFETSKQKMMEDARSQAFSMVRQTKESMDEMIREIKRLEHKRSSKEKDRRIDKIRKEMADYMGSLSPSIESMVVPKFSSDEITSLKPGEDVNVVTLRQEGIVVSADDEKKEAVVQMGIMKMTLPYKSLKKLSKKEKNTITKTTRKTIRAKSGQVRREVDLRGKNVEDALEMLSKYLDDATMAGHDEVSIIHGVGTGAVKKSVGEFVKKSPHVKSSRGGQYGEGGAGVTIAKLK